MELDLSSLQKAIDSLEKTIRVAENKAIADGLDRDVKDAIKAGVIQNFEFTYELCWKFMKRWLSENATVEDAELPRSRKELFRLAARFGLLDNPLSWFSYGDARNLTSHTYDENKAQTVYETAIDFLEDAKDFLKKIEENND